MKILMTLATAVVVLSTSAASAMTCTDPNVGKSGWSQRADCSKDGDNFSCNISGRGPGPGFNYSARGKGQITGSRSGGQRLSAKWTGDAFVGNYTDGNGKAWPIRLACNVTKA